MRDMKRSLKGGSMDSMSENKSNWPGVGPGPAARKKGANMTENPMRKTPGNPGNITVYQEGDSPPKGYRK